MGFIAKEQVSAPNKWEYKASQTTFHKKDSVNIANMNLKYSK